MNKILSTSFAMIAALAALPACADTGVYAGAALGTKGTMVGSTDSTRPFKLYGGYALNEHVAIEGAYTSFGVFKYSGNRRIGLHVFSVAAKGTLNISESWTAFGKVGVARHMINVNGDGLSIREQDKTRALVGAGVGYKLTPNLTLELELASYGKIKLDKGRLNYNQLQLGANYRF